MNFFEFCAIIYIIYCFHNLTVVIISISGLSIIIDHIPDLIVFISDAFANVFLTILGLGTWPFRFANFFLFYDII